jgi:S1-C subfamily serine protease
MKRLVMLCGLSAVVGAAAAVLWYGLVLGGESSAVRESLSTRDANAQSPPPPSPWSPRVSPAPVPPSPGSAPAVAPHGPTDFIARVYSELTPEEQVNVAVYQNVNRSVVYINTRGVQTDRFMMFEVPSEGEGSGTVLDRQGHVLTNYHVIEAAREIQVTLYDGKTYPAELVGIDPPTDVAVLRIDAPADSLHPVVFGDSAALLVGQRVFAIGNPFGLERTLSTGIISSLNRSLPVRRTARYIKQVIQIDAAINPGNSGGPLLDSRGRMIGMNMAIASRTGESAGVGFAIPVNTIARVVPELLRHGRVTRPDLGIVRTYQTDRGLLIAAVVPGGAAEKAGLRGFRVVRERRQEGAVVYERQYVDRSTADVIVAADGQPVKTLDELLTVVEAKQPGDVVVLSVLREGKRVDVPVRLEASE